MIKENKILTKYSLTIWKIKNGELLFTNEKEVIIDTLRKYTESADYALNEYGDAEDPTKWYSHEDDVNYISKKYPHLLFILDGVGEENGDLWKKYFKSGKLIQFSRAIITFESLDMTKLNT